MEAARAVSKTEVIRLDNGNSRCAYPFGLYGIEVKRKLFSRYVTVLVRRPVMTIVTMGKTRIVYGVEVKEYGADRNGNHSLQGKELPIYTIKYDPCAEEAIRNFIDERYNNTFLGRHLRR